METEIFYGLFMILLFIGLIVFVVIILPLWMILHYSRSKSAHRILARQDRDELRALEEEANLLSDRIEVLETILEAESPRWRLHREGEREERVRESS